jgi:[protein-PII] uridylyltransferase
VGDDECLRELFLVTVVDVTTTSPSSMTNWKRQVIDDLFRATLRHLTGAPKRWSQGPTTTRELVLKRCESADERALLNRFLEDAPARYLHAFSPRSILAHARFARGAAEAPVRVEMGRRRGAYAELWIAADDRPGVLMRIAAALHESRLGVLRADVCSFRDATGGVRCFDIVWVKGLFGRRPVDETIARLEATLLELMQLGGSELSRRLVSSSEWQPAEPRMPTEVHVDNRTASDQTVVEVLAADRPLLLHTIAAVFEGLGLSVSSAKINTEGQRAVDVFCVTDDAGEKLSRRQAREVERRLLEALQSPQATVQAIAGGF